MPTYKFTAIFGLQPGVDPDATYQLWRGEHAGYAKRLTRPEARQYTINRVVHGFGDVDSGDVWGIAEFWFDDMESVHRAMQRLQAAAPDAFHTNHITPARRLITREEGIELAGGGAGVVKLVSIFSLHPGVDPDEAYRVWRDQHTRWAQDHMCPEMKRYVLHRVTHKYPPAGGTVAAFDIYGYAMAWFDDLEAARRAAGRLRSAPPDAFLSRWVATTNMVLVAAEPIPL